MHAQQHLLRCDATAAGDDAVRATTSVPMADVDANAGICMCVNACNRACNYECMHVCMVLRRVCGCVCKSGRLSEYNLQCMTS